MLQELRKWRNRALLALATTFPYFAIRIFGMQGHPYGCSSVLHERIAIAYFFLAFAVGVSVGVDAMYFMAKASVENPRHPLHQFYSTAEERAAPLLKFTKGWWCALAGLIMIATFVAVDYLLC